MHGLAYRQIGEQLEEVLKQLPPMFHKDAPVATAFAANELQYVKARTIDVTKFALKARINIPVSREAAPGAETIAVDSYDSLGEAEITDNYAGDSPEVSVNKTRTATTVVALRARYVYTLQDLRAIAMTNSRLNIEKAMQARRAIEAKLDQIAVKGAAKINKTGFANDGNVAVYSDPFDWTMASDPADVVAQMHAFAAFTHAQMGDVQEGLAPDRMLLATNHFEIASSLVFAPYRPDISVLKAFLMTDPYIQTVDQWAALNTMGVSSVERAVCYKRDPSVVELEIPQDYEELPVDVDGHKYTTECHLRTAGTSVHRPLAMAYADGTATLTP
jgi:hypothetical protein